MSSSEPPYDPYIPSGSNGATAATAATSSNQQNGNQRTAALQAVSNHASQHATHTPSSDCFGFYSFTSKLTTPSA
jgi:hypothetical protein